MNLLARKFKETLEFDEFYDELQSMGDMTDTLEFLVKKFPKLVQRLKLS